MGPETRSVLHWTLGSGALWGGLFLGVAAFRSTTVGVAPWEVAAPLMALGLIGATVGGLTGPLVRLIWRRFRSARA